MRDFQLSNPIFITRKCERCKEVISINKDNVNEVIFYDKKTYHRKCFISICEQRMKNKRSSVAEKWKWVNENIDQIGNESKRHFMNALYKEEINQFILSEYDISIIPSSVWQKLGYIYSGTFRGMSVGISPEELIDMWKRKIDYLNKIANQNITKGKEMNPEQRINYDLSILINKYDGYLKWKESQKMLGCDNQSIKTSNSLSISIINEISKSNMDNCESGEINDLVDDIFS